MNWLGIFGGTLQQMLFQDAVLFAMAAIGINVHFGYTGLLNFGQVAWMAVGAYALAISAAYWGWPLWLGVLFVVVVSVAFSLLMGIPTLRLRGDYLAIATVAASAIVKTVFKHGKWAGGGDGIFARKPPGVGNWADGFTPDWVSKSKFRIHFTGFSLNATTLWFLAIAWTCVILSALLVWILMRSPWGRVLRAIREDEDAARALGKNTFSFKMQSLILGGLFGSLAGILMALGYAVADPESFNPQVTYLAWAALIIGGISAAGGPIAGSMIFWGLVGLTEQILQEAKRVGAIDFLSDDRIAQIRFILVGLGLVMVIVLRPQGIFGNKKEMSLDAR